METMNIYQNRAQQRSMAQTALAARLWAAAPVMRMRNMLEEALLC